MRAIVVALTLAACSPPMPPKMTPAEMQRSMQLSTQGNIDHCPDLSYTATAIDDFNTPEEWLVRGCDRSYRCRTYRALGRVECVRTR